MINLIEILGIVYLVTGITGHIFHIAATKSAMKSNKVFINKVNQWQSS